MVEKVSWYRAVYRQNFPFWIHVKLFEQNLRIYYLDTNVGTSKQYLQQEFLQEWNLISKEVCIQEIITDNI